MKSAHIDDLLEGYQLPPFPPASYVDSQGVRYVTMVQLKEYGADCIVAGIQLATKAIRKK